MTKVAILTNVIPVYREGFYERLFAVDNISVTVFCQSEVPGINYKTIHDKFPNNVHLVKYWAAKNEKIVWQCIPYLKILREYDVVFIDGNPRIISQAFFATFLRIIGRKVVVWSMVHSFLNNRFTENIRLTWLRIFKNHFVYNDNDVVKLQQMGFTDKLIIGMNNGLDQKKIDAAMAEWSVDKLTTWRENMGFNGRKIIISCGRLIDKNNYDLIIKALPALIEKEPDILWVAVGDGASRGSLEKQVNEANLQNFVHFAGEIYDDQKLAPYFLSSKLFVHPAGIGLSIMHAFGFGLPIITHDQKDLHSPEYAAFEAGKTGLNFTKGDFSALASVILDLLAKPKLLEEMKVNVLKITREKYNVEIMANRFLKMVRSLN